MAIPDERFKAASTRLLAALAEAGAAIEDIPHDHRWEMVENALAELDLDPGENSARIRTFLIGVMVVAHDIGSHESG
jgi:hypothetical protein